MESEFKLILRIANLLGFVFGACIGIAAGDAGMVLGAVAGAIIILLATPSVARYWSKREEVPTE